MAADDVSRMLRHGLRTRILTVIYERGEASPADVAVALGEPLGNVSYHTHVLHDGGWIELLRTERRGGGRRHVYRMHTLLEIDDATWTKLPVMLRRALTHESLRRVVPPAMEALRSGGFDVGWAHTSIVPLQLDERGIGELGDLLIATIRETLAIRDRSAARRAGGDAPPTQLAILHHALVPPPDATTRGARQR